MSANGPRYTNQLSEKGPATMGLTDTLSVMKKIFFDRAARVPTAKLPEVRPDMVAFLLPSDSMKFIWFGHSTLLLHFEGKTILIDPVFFNASPVSFLIPRFQSPVLKLEELPHIDTIVISHDHYDHLDELTVKFFKSKTANFLVPTGVGKHLQEWGIERSRITELGWHESITDKEITYRAVPAQHFSGRGLFDRNKTLWASWIIEGKNEKIYFSGDSGHGPHFKEIGDKYGPFDYAFIENGQYNERWPDVHMQPEESLQALIDLNAHTFIPVHWGMFDLALHHWTEPVARTHKIAKAWDIPIITPRLGEIVDMENRPDSDWWSEVKAVPDKEQKCLCHFLPEMVTK